MILPRSRLAFNLFATNPYHNLIRYRPIVFSPLFYNRVMNSSSYSRQYVAVPGANEWIEDYTVGGYHPVHLGDVFKDRYHVLRKLGHGRYATVWLAHDTISSKHVALKICVASEDTEARREADILTELQNSTTISKRARLPITKIFDRFVHHGPNGDHLVMSFEPLGQTVQQLIQSIVFIEDTSSEVKDVDGLRRISRQMVEALQFIHSKGVVHRDVQPQNFMFELRKPVSEILDADRGEPRTFPVERLDRKPLDNHAPTYIVNSWPILEDMIEKSRLLNSRIVLTDFGAATDLSNANNGEYTYPLPLRAPEILLGLPLTEKSDIWALGCTIYHLVTLTNLFYLDTFEGIETQDTQQLQSMIEVLGPMPKQLIDSWERRNVLFDEQGNLLPERVEDPMSDPLITTITQFRPKSMSAEETALFESFLRSIFQYEVDKRPSASDLLQHPWINHDGKDVQHAHCVTS